VLLLAKLTESEPLCGEVMFQHYFPINPSQMTRWRVRIPEKGAEKLLQATIHAGKNTGTITDQSFEEAIVGTTVQLKRARLEDRFRLVGRKRYQRWQDGGAELEASREGAPDPP